MSRKREKNLINKNQGWILREHQKSFLNAPLKVLLPLADLCWMTAFSS
jgi:hypothetical protein